VKLNLARFLGCVALAAVLGALLWCCAPGTVGERPPPVLPEEPSNRPLPVAENARLEQLEGGWVLNDVWSGYMGVAILFRQDSTFDYWQYSDVVTGREPIYPITGRWKWKEHILELESEHHLHDTHWYVFWHEGKPALLPAYARQWQVDDGKAHDDRLLFRVAKFDPARPFDNRP
jgi:hypothetical protein